RHQPMLEHEPRQRDEQRGLARRQVDRRQLVALVERVAAAAPAIGAERQAGVLQRFEIAVDRPERHAEAIGELLGGHAGPAGAEGLGEREQAGLAAHQMKPDKRLSNRAGNVKPMHNNAITWFEIPVRNLAKASSFYSSLVGRPLSQEVFGGIPHAMFAASGDHAVTGALIENPKREPGASGVTIYLDVAEVQAAADRA